MKSNFFSDNSAQMSNCLVFFNPMQAWAWPGKYLTSTRNGNGFKKKIIVIIVLNIYDRMWALLETLDLLIKGFINK